MEQNIEELCKKHAQDLADEMIPRLEAYWFNGKKIDIYHTDMEMLLLIFKDAFVKFAQDLNG